jgi:hypothetical protein
MLRVLRQLRSKDGGAGCRTVPCHAGPCRATLRGARPGAAFCTTALNLRQIEFGEFGSGSAKNTGWAQTTLLQNCNPIFYQLRHTYLLIHKFLTQAFSYCTNVLYHSILYYTKLYYTILYYTILYYTILYYTILYYTILFYTILYYTILYYTIVPLVSLCSTCQREKV